MIHEIGIGKAVVRVTTEPREAGAVMVEMQRQPGVGV